MEKINFKIEHIDPLGQGVSKENEIAFIEKTLPGEEGSAVVYRKAKGVVFGKLNSPQNLTIKSPDRIEPECSHFYECRGCQYLHTNYKTELKFKTESLHRMFDRLLPEYVEIKTHSAKNRFGYRNRVQIHYNLEKNEFGLISSHSEQLINASECLLPSASVSKAVINLYKNNRWKEIVENNADKAGYFEVYLKAGETIPEISVNKPYAEGGFTQVNNEMGKVLTDLVTSLYNKYLINMSEPMVMDIFGGNGNLSKNFKNARIKIYDRYTPKQSAELNNKSNKEFISIDLYKHNPVNKLQQSLGRESSSSPDLIVFDPPRAGVKFIDSYIEKLDSSYIFYISCDPSTLKRDTLKIIDKYNILGMHLIDLFPGTRHFETLIVFKKH
ncbi:MAG: class I SAM-dependent RNA methyltransferase [Spirochaetaceae bacterium]|nr:class I SAM-dependent RNA methyltransferase [Spirochaetaceae bacterium]